MPEKSSVQNTLAAWRKRYRDKLQLLALLVSLAAPFALFGSLNQGLPLVSAILFVLMALCMLIVAWVG